MVLDSGCSLSAVPALAPVPGVIKTRLIHTTGSNTNTGWHLYWHTTTPPTQAQVTNHASVVATNWGSYLAPHHETTTALTEVTATDLSSSTGPVGIWSGNKPGTETGGMLPANVCLLGNFAISRRYRGGKPRVYIPAMTTTDLQDEKHWIIASLSSFQVSWNGFMAAIKSDLQSWAPSAAHCNVSYWSGGSWVTNPSGRPIWRPTPRPGGPLIDAVTAVTFNPIIGSQRRRLRPG